MAGASAYPQLFDRAAAAYGFDADVLRQVNRLENGGRFDMNLNDWDSNAAAGTPSGGALHFIKPTFDAYAKQAKAANPAAWRGVQMKWENPYAQLLAGSWAMKNGKGSAWTTYDRAVKAAGGVQLTRPETTPAASSAAATPSVVSSTTSGRFSPEQAAVLRTVFDKNPRMQRMIDLAGVATAASADPSVPAPARRAARDAVKSGPGTDYLSLISWAQKNFGARLDNPDPSDPGNSQTIGGKHTAGSRHYAKKAIDLGNAKNDAKRLRRIAAYVRRHPQQFNEFFWNPAGFAVIDGKIVKGHVEPGHDDHAHLSV